MPERHRVLVNGSTLPLRPTGTAGERVGGVRFRAWAPPHACTPHLGIHHPLRFDVFDTLGRGARSAACAYHVWHPEGRGFDAPPLTRFEAAARRAQRFTRRGARALAGRARAGRSRTRSSRTRSTCAAGPCDRPMPARRGQRSWRDATRSSTRAARRTTRCAARGPRGSGSAPSRPSRDRALPGPVRGCAAEGGDKEERARARSSARFVADASRRAPRRARAVGRQYPGEARPRFCFGARWRPRRRARLPALTGPGRRLRSPAGVAPAAGPARRLRRRLAHRHARSGRGRGQPGARARPRHLRRPTPRPSTPRRRAAGLSPVRYRYNGDDDRLGRRRPAHARRADARSGARSCATRTLLPGLVRYLEQPPVALLLVRARVRRAAPAGAAARRGRRASASTSWRSRSTGSRPQRRTAAPPELWARAGAAPRRRLRQHPPRRAQRREAVEPAHRGRGKMGVVELRSLRMQPDPARMVAVAALFRAVVARLCARPVRRAARRLGRAAPRSLGAARLRSRTICAPCWPTSTRTASASRRRSAPLLLGRRRACAGARSAAPP